VAETKRASGRANFAPRCAEAAFAGLQTSLTARVAEHQYALSRDAVRTPLAGGATRLIPSAPALMVLDRHLGSGHLPKLG
jgi:hypothetical protein